MSNPIQLPADFETYDFVAMSKKERNSRNKIRLISMSHIQDGKTLKETGLALKVHWSTIQTWLRNFRNSGIEHLYVKTTKVKPFKISKKIETWIVEFLTMLNNHDTGGHITGNQLQSIITEKFSIKCCLQTVYNTLHRLKFSWITSRSKHPKSDLEVQELIKNFPQLIKKLLPDSIDISTVDIWQQDESRVGQQGSTTRIWAKIGTRPRKVRQQQFISTYIYGAVCAKTGDAFGLVLPYTNTEAMQLFVNELSFHINDGRHIALVIDNAGWHTATELVVPQNITLIPLPPYSPELNAVEQVWNWIKSHYLSNCNFKDYNDIVDKASFAWNEFAKQPDLVKSMCSRGWLQTL